MLDQAPCGPAVPCLSRQARAAVMVRLRGEADAGQRSAVSGHRSPVKQVIGRQCHSGVSVLPNKAVIFLKIFREIYICPKRVLLGEREEPPSLPPVRVCPAHIVMEGGARTL